MKKQKCFSLDEILKQNPISCGNCYKFKIVKKNDKLHARCILGLMERNKKHWTIERRFSHMPFGWQEAERCRHFAGEICDLEKRS